MATSQCFTVAIATAAKVVSLEGDDSIANIYIDAIEDIYDVGDTALTCFMLAGFEDCNPSIEQRIEGYVERVVPLYSCSTFKSHFRMTRSSVEVCIPP